MEGLKKKKRKQQKNLNEHFPALLIIKFFVHEREHESLGTLGIEPMTLFVKDGQHSTTELTFVSPPPQELNFYSIF